MPYVIVLLVDIIGMLVHNAIEAVLEASFETKIELLCLFLTQQLSAAVYLLIQK